LSVVISGTGVRVESTHPDTRSYILTSAVLVINLALALAPAVIGLLVLFGLLR